MRRAYDALRANHTDLQSSRCDRIDLRCTEEEFADALTLYLEERSLLVCPASWKTLDKMIERHSPIAKHSLELRQIRVPCVRDGLKMEPFSIRPFFRTRLYPESLAMFFREAFFKMVQLPDRDVFLRRAYRDLAQPSRSLVQLQLQPLGIRTLGGDGAVEFEIAVPLVAKAFEDRFAAFQCTQLPIRDAGKKRGASFLADQFAPARLQFDPLVIRLPRRIDCDSEHSLNAAPDGCVADFS